MCAVASPRILTSKTETWRDMMVRTISRFTQFKNSQFLYVSQILVRRFFSARPYLVIAEDISPCTDSIFRSFSRTNKNSTSAQSAAYRFLSTVCIHRSTAYLTVYRYEPRHLLHLRPVFVADPRLVNFPPAVFVPTMGIVIRIRSAVCARCTVCNFSDVYK